MGVISIQLTLINAVDRILGDTKGEHVIIDIVAVVVQSLVIGYRERIAEHIELLIGKLFVEH